MSRFDPEYYSRYRPYYPVELFASLVPALARRGFAAPYAIADVGCGTGHSTESLRRAGIAATLVGVDPDPAMLDRARVICPTATFAQGSGESTGLPGASADVVTIGSAFHWMDALRTREEVLRVLRPSGLLMVYEYQFPKAAALPELNEWVRREFNLRWKAPGQRPRGAFDQVTGCFRTDRARLALLEDRKVPMVLPLDADALTGLILSQSRVLHYQNTMVSDQERARFRIDVTAQISHLMPQATEFDFSLQSALFVAL